MSYVKFGQYNIKRSNQTVRFPRTSREAFGHYNGWEKPFKKSSVFEGPYAVFTGIVLALVAVLLIANIAR